MCRLVVVERGVHATLSVGTWSSQAGCRSLTSLGKRRRKNRPMNSWLKPYEQSPRQGSGFSDFGGLQRPVLWYTAAQLRSGVTPVRGVARLRE